MRDSLKKLQEACDPANDEKHWYSNLEQSQWLHHAKVGTSFELKARLLVLF